MTSVTTASPALEQPQSRLDLRPLANALRSGVIVALSLAALVALLRLVLRPLIASTGVEENLTRVLSDVLLAFLPYLTYIAAGSAVRKFVRTSLISAVASAVVAAAVLYGGITLAQSVLNLGAFAPAQSLEMELVQTPDGILVESVTPDGAADIAGFQPGDLITGIRRDPIDLEGLNRLISQSNVGDPIRLRFIRDGEETQQTVRVTLAETVNEQAIVTGFFIALAFSVVAIFWPGKLTPYVLIIGSLLPLIVGYTWLIIATFSYRTEGLKPIGGLTLDNWKFLTERMESIESVWPITLNTLAIAIFMTVLVLTVSSMAGYALSRMNFPGRRTFLSFTLILHGFPAVTLLISIFFVLNFISKIPVLGGILGYNTPGGIALVMVAFELPLGIWLMKGFFDNISWDMERSALIDGASRWRTFWEIILPQIRPGILALGIFAFISGWNAYLIPRTYSIGTNTVTLSVFLKQFIDDTAPVNWNMVAAVGLFQLIPVFIFFVFAQEYLLNIYAGGMKGSN